MSNTILIACIILSLCIIGLLISALTEPKENLPKEFEYIDDEDYWEENI